MTFTAAFHRDIQPLGDLPKVYFKLSARSFISQTDFVSQTHVLEKFKKYFFKTAKILIAVKGMCFSVVWYIG